MIDRMFVEKRQRERLIGEGFVSDLGLLGCWTPTATLDSEIQPAVKGRRISLSILSLISSSNTNTDAEKGTEREN